MARRDLSDKVIFEQQPDEEIANHAIPERGNSRYKGREAKECFTVFKELQGGQHGRSGMRVRGEHMESGGWGEQRSCRSF